MEVKVRLTAEDTVQSVLQKFYGLHDSDTRYSVFVTEDRETFDILREKRFRFGEHEILKPDANGEYTILGRPFRVDE